MRTLCSVLCTLLATAACGDLAPPAIEQGVSVSPRQLDFGELFVGQSRALEVEIINRGLRPLEVVAQTAPPFSLETHRFEILAGESRRLRVELQAVVVGSVARTLHLTAGSEVIAVDLVAHSAAAPACGAPGPCRFSSFDPVSGQCTTANLVDDTPCSQGCVRFGKCRAGQCVGTPVNCDDRNVCTIDSCNENGSCTHAPITCPESDDPCALPVCHPMTGCTVHFAADGTPCGETPCSTSSFCHGGVCQKVQSRDGASCNVCGDRGLCRAGGCTTPAALQLEEAWSYAPAPGYGWAYRGIMDPQGNSYWLEWRRCTQSPCTSDETLVSVDRLGRTRFRAALGPMPQASLRDSDLHRQMLLGDELVVASGTVLQARRISDGSLLWSVELEARLPFELTRPAHVGGLVASRDGTSIVGVLAVQRGEYHIISDLERMLFVFDRSTHHVEIIGKTLSMVRALFTDSSGNMYVFSDCSYDCHVAPHRAASYGLDGLERPGRWTEPTYDGEKSATVSAIWDDVLFLDSYDQSQLIDARTGEPLHELPFASRAPAVMRGSLGFVAGLGLRPCTRDDGWCPSGSTPAAQKRLFGFDLSTGHSSWSAELPERTLAGPLLTARDSVLIASADATCGARLHEFSLGGVQLNTWILPPAAGATLHPRWGPFEAEHVAALGPNLLVIGTDSEVPGYGHETAQLVAFELPGISPAEEGWISESGNMGRDGRPR